MSVLSVERNSAGNGSLQPVFIVGGARTGSEMLKTMLSASAGLDFVDELFLFCPRWLHRDLKTTIEDEVGPIDRLDSVVHLVDLLMSGRPYGWIWSVAEEKFDRDVLLRELENHPRSYKTLLTALMRAHARKSGKRGLGAKFPCHYSYTDQLLAWYPECRLIHTTRDARAVYASQSNKYITDQMSSLQRGWTKLQHFAHINIQIAWTAHLHRKLRHLPNYRLVRYEDVVRRPESTLRELCEFLDVEFVHSMLAPEQYGSSFATATGRKGVDTSALDRWRSVISPWTAMFLSLVHGRAARDFGYQEKGHDG